MKSPLDSGTWLALDSVVSTQDVAADCVKGGRNVGVVFALDQTGGRGRFDRTWISAPGDSLTMSLIFRDYANHPLPHLIGMELAIAAAGVVHSQLRWPNDLTIHKRKVGGILTEMVTDESGRRVPVVGIGINLNQTFFPDELNGIATSMAIEAPGRYDAEEVARAIVQRASAYPEPTAWSELAPLWNLFDDTPGKRYRLVTGENAVALGVGTEGELLCSVEGETTTVMAAEALFGSGS